MYFSLPNSISDMSLTFSPNSSNTWNIALFFLQCVRWSLKICLLKKFPNSEKSNSITIVIFDKRIHILYRLSLHGLMFKYNKVLKYLYGRGKVLVYDKMAKMANFWKISHFSHFSKNGDFLKKLGKVGTFWEKSRLFGNSRNFLEKVGPYHFLAFATFSKKSRFFEKLKSRNFF